MRINSWFCLSVSGLFDGIKVAPGGRTSWNHSPVRSLSDSQKTYRSGISDRREPPRPSRRTLAYVKTWPVIASDPWGRPQNCRGSCGARADGRRTYLERLRGSGDAIPGVGRSLAKRLHETPHAKTLEQLKAALHENGPQVGCRNRPAAARNVACRAQPNVSPHPPDTSGPCG